MTAITAATSAFSLVSAADGGRTYHGVYWYRTVKDPRYEHYTWRFDHFQHDGQAYTGII